MNTTGVVSYSDLRQEGASRADIDRALAAGNITRVARGWYSYPHADQRVVRALAAGGRLGCLSGCAVYGLWVPSDPHLHVVYGRGKVPAPKPGVDLHLMDLPRPKAPMWTLPQLSLIHI